MLHVVQTLQNTTLVVVVLATVTLLENKRRVCEEYQWLSLFSGIFFSNDLPLQSSISKYDEEADTICYLVHHFRFMKRDLDLSHVHLFEAGLI
jgi:hypothetical protein